MANQSGAAQLRRTKPVSPSKLHLYAVCPLRYLSDTEGVQGPKIPSGLSALRGVILHSLIQMNLGEPMPASAILRTKFLEEAERKAAAHANLLIRMALSDAGINALFPIRVVQSDAQFVRDVLSKYYRQPVTTASTGTQKQGKNAFRFGAERKLVSDRLDMEGRLDLVYKDGFGVIHIVDYKSGKVVGADGFPADKFLLQIAAYALMVKELLSPPKAIILELVSPSSEWEGQFDEQLETRINSLLLNLLTRLPRNGDIQPIELASRGAHCNSCAFRPSCPAYTADMDAMVPNNLNPADTAGTLLEVRQEGGLATLRVETGARAKVAISGVPYPENTALRSGAHIRAFGLGIYDVMSRAAFPANFYMYRSDNPANSAFASLITTVETA